MLAVLIRIGLSFQVQDPDECPALVDLVAEHSLGNATIGVTVQNVFDYEWTEAQGDPPTTLATFGVRF
jgi:hypothetical protein